MSDFVISVTGKQSLVKDVADYYKHLSPSGCFELGNKALIKSFGVM